MTMINMFEAKTDLSRLVKQLEDNEEEDANGIEEPEIDTVKTIDRDGTEQIFDLTGRRLQRSPEHGFYILNGKKYFKK